MKKLLVLAILLASLQVFSQENVLNTVLRANKTDSTVVVGDTLNGIKLSPDGLYLKGSATMFEDLRIDAMSTPANADEPALTGGFGGAATMFQRIFQGSVRDDKIYFNIQLPHAWKEGGFLELHIHTAPWTTPAATDTVVWGLQYNWQNINGTYTTPTLTKIKQPLGGVAQWQHKLVEIVNFNTSGKTLSGIITCTLSRLANSDASDTYLGGMTVLYIDAHYEVNSLGSGQELIK